MLRLKRPLDVGFINRNFFSDFQNYPDIINTGKCFLWAYIAYRLYAGVELWDMPVHAFVKYNSRFYDSESPLGELDWQKLPATYGGVGIGCDGGVKDLARSYTVAEFKKISNWGSSARRFDVIWSDVRVEVQKVVAREIGLSRNRLRARSIVIPPTLH